MRKLMPGLAAIALALLSSALMYDRLPERIPTHFNLQGEPDSWTGRAAAAFLLPVFATGLLLLAAVLPRISPRRENLLRSEKAYWLAINMTVAFVCALHVLILGRALGWPIDITSAVLIGIGLLFVVLGALLPRVQSNWWLGIRTPWTMDSENVWQQTHRVAGRTFTAGGLMTMAAGLLPPAFRPWLALVGLLVAGFVPVVYSYLLWRRERHA